MTKKAPRRPAKSVLPTPDPVVLGESASGFQKDGAKRSRLIAILSDPVFREAAAILKDEIEPRGDLKIFLESETVSAHRYHQFAGLNYLLDGFRRLTKEHQEVKIPQGKRLTTELPK